MTDRELLEMAAKAAGMNVPEWESQQGHFYWVPAHGFWNPLADDGDALRLAVQLELQVTVIGDGMAQAKTEAGNVCCFEHDGSEYNTEAATRRAIVRAAAEIGRAKA